VCRRTCHFLRHDFGQKLLPPLWGGITAVSVRGQRGNDLSWEECFYSVAVRVRVAEKPVAVVAAQHTRIYLLPLLAVTAVAVA
jgi:hypothetical protein